jgi:hypothetical protein
MIDNISREQGRRYAVASFAHVAGLRMRQRFADRDRSRCCMTGRAT